MSYEAAKQFYEREGHLQVPRKWGSAEACRIVGINLRTGKRWRTVRLRGRRSV